MESLSGSRGEFEARLARAYRPQFEDLEHYDEPSPEDAIELDEQVWAHIDSLLVGFAGECDDDFEERIAEADRLEDARIDEDEEDEDEGDEILDDEGELGDDDGGEDPPPAPCPPDRDADLLDVGRVGPPGPLAGALAQLAFGWGSAHAPARPSGRRDGPRPGDAPGWKGGAT